MRSLIRRNRSFVIIALALLVAMSSLLVLASLNGKDRRSLNKLPKMSIAERMAQKSRSIVKPRDYSSFARVATLKEAQEKVSFKLLVPQNGDIEGIYAPDEDRLVIAYKGDIEIEYGANSTEPPYEEIAGDDPQINARVISVRGHKGMAWEPGTHIYNGKDSMPHPGVISWHENGANISIYGWGGQPLRELWSIVNAMQELPE